MGSGIGDAARARPLRQELIGFVIAGVLGFVVDVGVLYCATALGAGWLAGRAVSFICAVWATWRFNRRFTFAPGSAVTAWREWWRYFSAMLLGGAVNYATYSAIMLSGIELPFLLAAAVAAGSVAGMIVNFVSAKYFVFRKGGVR